MTAAMNIKILVDKAAFDDLTARTKIVGERLSKAPGLPVTIDFDLSKAALAGTSTLANGEIMVRPSAYLEDMVAFVEAFADFAERWDRDRSAKAEGQG